MMPEMGFPGNRLWDEVHMQEVSGRTIGTDTCVKEGSEAGTNMRRGAAGMLAISDHPPREPWGPQQPGGWSEMSIRVVLQKTEVARPL